jgi:hypothetical protein
MFDERKLDVGTPGEDIMTMANNPTVIPECRICFESTGTLITPCGKIFIKFFDELSIVQN